MDGITTFMIGFGVSMGSLICAHYAFMIDGFRDKDLWEQFLLVMLFSILGGILGWSGMIIFITGWPFSFAPILIGIVTFCFSHIKCNID